MAELQNFERQVTRSAQGGLLIAYVLKREPAVRVFAWRDGIGIQPGDLEYTPESWIRARKHPLFGQMLGFSEVEIKELRGIWPDFQLAYKQIAEVDKANS